ncbi:uncharacterized protein J3R85_000306 [Psidium guajava]|nr:uncharacterized protein J3R85_000306 [Psidium guajava]
MAGNVNPGLESLPPKPNKATLAAKVYKAPSKTPLNVSFGTMGDAPPVRKSGTLAVVNT